MPKPFDIRIRVEEIALGSVMRKLHEMPGVVSVDLDLGKGGGTGAGVETLAAAAEQRSGNQLERIVRFLSDGPKKRIEIQQFLGAPKSSVYTALFKLKKSGVIKSLGKTVYGLTHATLALPAPTTSPTTVTRTATGRATPGSGPNLLRSILLEGPASPKDVYGRLGDHGMSTKSISGVMRRATLAGLVKKNGSKMYELTPKGIKMETAHHG